jgi:hypothetical protein
VAHIKGKTPQPLSFAWYGQAIALGPKDAVGFATYPADVPIGPVYRGKTAVAMRNFFVWFLKAVLECERRFPGFLFWNGNLDYLPRLDAHWVVGQDALESPARRAEQARSILGGATRHVAERRAAEEPAR